jgi:uncharacterized protein
MFNRVALRKLENWRKNPDRKPLIVRGARQVGKTTLVHEFGKQFKQYIYLNLEKQSDRLFFDHSMDVEAFVEQLFFRKRLALGQISDTLLFIDEIQEAPELINLLRYFKEEKKELAVIAAGSMLETLLGKQITFPVGRVEFFVLRPVSFDEFLGALGDEMAIKAFHEVPLKEYAYDSLLSLFHRYALLGGMPEIIEAYSKTKDVLGLAPIYNSLLDSYLIDAEKYAKSKEQLQLIRFVIHAAIHSAGKRITFQGFGNSNYKSREIGETLRTLQKTHLLHLIYPTTNTQIPQEVDFKKAPRLQFLDTGLMNFFVGLQDEILGSSNLDSVYKGSLIEHLVGQEIIVHQTYPLDKLSFWVRQKNSSQAEVDFIYKFKTQLIPVEVKSGALGKLKSLHQYMDSSEGNIAVRLNANRLETLRLQTPTGKIFYLLSLPYFLASKLEDYLIWFLDHLPIEVTVQPMVFQESAFAYWTSKNKNSKSKNDVSNSNLNKKQLSVLYYCGTQPRTAKEIIEQHLKLTLQTRNRQFYIRKLIDKDLLEEEYNQTYKGKEQKYRITSRGLGLLI